MSKNSMQIARRIVVGLLLVGAGAGLQAAMAARTTADGTSGECAAPSNDVRWERGRVTLKGADHRWGSTFE